MDPRALPALCTGRESGVAQGRWAAVAQRSGAADGQFVYGVKTTQIYCRPTCGARVARRANVEFFDSGAHARRHGFRACKRCRPDDAAFAGHADALVATVLALLRHSRGARALAPGLKDLAAQAGVSPSYLARVFKRKMRVSVAAYVSEFERDGAAGETRGGMLGTEVVGSVGSQAEEGGLVTTSPADMLVECPPVEDGMGSIAGKEVVGVEEALSVDVDFDEWLWADAFE